MASEDLRKPTILNSHDSYVRSLAESGYQLENNSKEYFDKVELYVRESASEIWDRSGTTDSTRIIKAKDFLSRYVIFRFTGLFGELWSNHPHYPDYLKGNFDTDQITISISKQAGQLVFSAEDENGFGVMFDSKLQSVAYGPLAFAETAEALNHKWRERGVSHRVTEGQSLLLLASESRGLEFKPD